MKRIEKFKIAVDVSLVFLIVTYVISLLSDITINCINIKSYYRGNYYINVFRYSGYTYILAILFIIALATILILLRKSVHFNNRTLILFAVGALLAVSGIVALLAVEIPSLVYIEYMDILTKKQLLIDYFFGLDKASQMNPIKAQMLFSGLQCVTGIILILFGRRAKKEFDVKTNLHISNTEDFDFEKICTTNVPQIPETKRTINQISMTLTQMKKIILKTSLLYFIISMPISLISRFFFNGSYPIFDLSITMYAVFFTILIAAIIILAILVLFYMKYKKVKMIDKSLSLVISSLILVLSSIPPIVATLNRGPFLKMAISAFAPIGICLFLFFFGLLKRNQDIN